MQVSTPVTKRRRTFQVECLEDRKLLHATVVTIGGHATGTFVNVPVSVSPPVFNTTIYGSGMAQGKVAAKLGPVTGVGQNTTEIVQHGKRATVVFSNGTGEMVDQAGDELFFTYSAKGAIGPAGRFRTSGVGIITGGTGIFAGASGRINAQGVGSIATDTFTLALVAHVRL